MVKKQGKIICHVGGMFAGKTKAWMRDIERNVYAKRKVQIFKHSIDCRYENEYAVSHDGDRIKAIPISDIRDIMRHLSIDTEIVGIDEAQFFSKEYTLGVVKTLRQLGIDVIIAGLDMTYEGEPFGVIPDLMAIANDVYKWKAVCSSCGEDAYISHRITTSTETIQVGEKESYTPLCYDCHVKKQKLKEKNKNIS